jgi:hypothetical protein
MTALAFEDKVRGDRPAFVAKVRAIASELGTNPNWLMGVMWAESRLNPKAQNTAYPVQGGYATGLIQFTPDTARLLGTSTAALLDMDSVQQLDYVKKYFRPYSGRLRSYFDVYAAVFFPAAIGKPDAWVFQTSRLSASTIARQNPAVDLNDDGKITVGEFKEYLKNTIPVRLRKLIFAAWNSPFAIVLTLGLVTYFILTD